MHSYATAVLKFAPNAYTSHVLCHVSDVNYIKVVAATYMYTVAPTPPLVF